MVEFLCPVVGSGMPPWHAAIHVGLAGIVSAVGSVFLFLAVSAYRRSDPRAVAERPVVPANAPSVASARLGNHG